MRAKYRAIFATLAIFVAIFGILAALHGLLFDQDTIVRYGAAAVVAGVSAFVLLLNPKGNIDDDSNTDPWK